VPKDETLGDRIRRIRHERGWSLARVSGADFSRAFLNQVELGQSQPSTRVLRVIAGRLGTEVDYLLEGRLPGVERELAVEKARVLLAQGDARRALAALGSAVDSNLWPLGTDASLCQAEALLTLGRGSEASEILAREKDKIKAHGDHHRLQRLRAVERGKRFVFSEDAVKAHLRLADRAQRAANSQDALEHYRAARVLLEARQGDPKARSGR
jgi:transcriptional regulator with XRE-family HTH domain